MIKFIIFGILLGSCTHPSKENRDITLRCNSPITSKTVNRDKNVKFKLGHKICQNDTPYSSLLRSDDTGVTWTDVSPKESLKAPSLIEFIDDSTGLMVLSHFHEGPGEEKLYITHDNGKNWSYVNIIPKSKPWHLYSVAKVCLKTVNVFTLKIYDIQKQKISNLNTYDSGKSFIVEPYDMCKKS